jgi:hypothetical protein
MTRPIDFVTELPKREFVSSCWHNSVSKKVIKSAAARARRKAILTLEEFYFSRKPHLQSRLQARLDELVKQEFPIALYAVSSKLHPDAYVFLSEMVISRFLGL